MFTDKKAPRVFAFFFFILTLICVFAALKPEWREKVKKALGNLLTLIIFLVAAWAEHREKRPRWPNREAKKTDEPKSEEKPAAETL